MASPRVKPLENIKEVTSSFSFYGGDEKLVLRLAATPDDQLKQLAVNLVENLSDEKMEQATLGKSLANTFTQIEKNNLHYDGNFSKTFFATVVNSKSPPDTAIIIKSLKMIMEAIIVRRNEQIERIYTYIADSVRRSPLSYFITEENRKMTYKDEYAEIERLQRQNVDYEVAVYDPIKRIDDVCAQFIKVASPVGKQNPPSAAAAQSIGAIEIKSVSLSENKLKLFNKSFALLEIKINDQNPKHAELQGLLNICLDLKKKINPSELGLLKTKFVENAAMLVNYQDKIKQLNIDQENQLKNKAKEVDAVVNEFAKTVRILEEKRLSPEKHIASIKALDKTLKFFEQPDVSGFLTKKHIKSLDEYVPRFNKQKMSMPVRPDPTAAQRTLDKAEMEARPKHVEEKVDPRLVSLAPAKKQPGKSN